jgi:hypothetical protein
VWSSLSRAPTNQYLFKDRFLTEKSTVRGSSLTDLSIPSTVVIDWNLLPSQEILSNRKGVEKKKKDYIPLVVVLASEKGKDNYR